MHTLRIFLISLFFLINLDFISYCVSGNRRLSKEVRMTFNPKLNPIFYIVIEGEFIDVQRT